MSTKPKRRPRRRKHHAAPTARVLPGELPKVEFPMQLKCTRCGVTGRYHLGTIFVSPELRGKDHTAIDEFIGFSGYVRCKGCDAGGPWTFPSDAVMCVIALIAMKLERDVDVPLELGEMRTFDNHRFRYPTQAEEHLQGLIEREPERAFLWVRLGNVYSGGGRPDLAEPAYRRAVELSPDDFEARAGMAELLQETGRDSEAMPHWQWVLRLARTAKGVDAPLRRSAVSVAVDSLLHAFRDKPERLRFYPEGEESPMPKLKDNKVILHLRQFDLSDPNDLEELCDFFLPPSDTRDFSGRKIQHRHRAPRLSFGAAPAPLELDDPIAVRSDGSASRNEPCPCGSGRKFKKCCGAVAAVLRT